MIDKLKDNSGVTLIETIVSLMLLSILLGGITVVFSTTQRLNKELIYIARQQIIADEVTADILDDLRMAKDVDLSDASVLKIQTDKYTVLYSIDDSENVLQRSWEGAEDSTPKPVLAPGYYMGHTLMLNWHKIADIADGDYAIALDLTLSDTTTGDEYVKQYLVRPPL